jgi:hypothetical protein
MMVMRSRIFLFTLTLATVLTASAVSAQNADEVAFVSGTGQVSDTGDVAYDDNAYPDSYAEDYADDDSSLDELAGKMSDRDRQDGVANSVERMSAALLGMRVGPLAAAIENARPGTVRRSVRRNTTIGDLAGRDSEYLPEELGARSREMMGMMGGFAQAMASMMPEFRRMGREMEASVRAAKDEARRD